MQKFAYVISICVGVLLAFSGIALLVWVNSPRTQPLQTLIPESTALPAPSSQLSAVGSIATPVSTSTPYAPSLFIYSFNSPGILQEAPSMEKSTSPYWWLDSGGTLTIQGGIGYTAQGISSLTDRWRIAYAATSRIDTDLGAYPQNLLRLVSRTTWENVRQEASFRVEADNFTTSPNRNASNGLLLMSRYRDYNTLYYAGIRVDGTAVIKKKYKGTYYTLAQKPIFPGTYSPTANINLIPHNEWIHLRNETVTNADGSVSVRLYMKRANETSWKLLIEAKDASGKYGGTPPIIGAGHIGIRTDFMDVAFDAFRAQQLN